MRAPESITPPPPLDVLRTALFLDLDGTIAPLEARPDLVGPDQRRTQTLKDLARRMEGRLAVLSGRGLEDVDRILEGAVIGVAAVHGLILRSPGGEVTRFLPSPDLLQAKQTLDALAGARTGLIVEDKGASLALHYRQAPGAEEAVREATRRIADATGLVVQDGSMVSELRTAGPHKGDSLRALMAAAPFAGSRPVMVGDDLTDEHAFAAAEELGGFGVLVGAARATNARHHLRNVGEVLDWLEVE